MIYNFWIVGRVSEKINLYKSLKLKQNCFYYIFHRAKRRNLDRFVGGGNTVSDNNAGPSGSTATGTTQAYRRYVSGSNVHRLADRKDSDDENATWNGNSTQQQ